MLNPLVIVGVGLAAKYLGLTCFVPGTHTLNAGYNAALNGDIAAIVTLVYNQVGHSYSLCTSGQTLESQLSQAVANEDVKKVQEILNTSAEANVSKAAEDPSNELGDSPLHLACAKGSLPVVKMLLKQGANINAKNKEGVTPLMTATSKGHKELVQYLLENGADCAIQAGNGSTALMFASSAGHVEIVEILIQNRCGIDLQKTDGFTALMLASRNGRFKVVNALLKAGARFDLVKKDGWSALMLAAFNGQAPCVQLLLEKDADPTLLNSEGDDAWDLAKSKNFLGIVRSLEAGVDKAKLQKEETAQREQLIQTKIAMEKEFKEKLEHILDSLSLEEQEQYLEELKATAEQVPWGPYRWSCKDSVLSDDGKQLISNCLQEGLGYKKSTLNLPCDYQIDVHQGKLACTTQKEVSTVPDGPYKKTCDSCFVEGGILQCYCAYTDYKEYKYIPSYKYPVLKLPCRGRIENRAGSLVCEK